ncbi:MAG: hypothetical protein H6R02_192 [Burkholderiaceae bacterium]|jgi:hypothetical protein|nr:hypothetical protein [Burkholderiaceae bacterium]
MKFKKTRVEVRKTELEIQEKSASLKQISELQPDVARALIDPLIEAKHIQGFVLRFLPMAKGESKEYPDSALYFPSSNVS